MIEALQPVYVKLDGIATWPDNWDSYGAKKPDPETLERGKEWITAFYVFVAHKNWIEPSIFPQDEAPSF